MKNVCAVIFCFFLVTCFRAQDSLTPVKRIRVDDVGMQLTLLTEFKNTLYMSDIQKIAPQNSMIYKADISTYDQGKDSRKSFNSLNINSSPVFSMYSAFKFSDKNKTAYKKNIQFRAGLAFYKQQSNAMAQTITSKRADTLYSNTTGSKIFLDSINAKTYTANYSTKMLRIDLSFLISTNRQKPVYLYTGAGIAACMSFNTTVNVAYLTSNTVYGSNQKHDNSFPYAALDQVFVKQESFRVNEYDINAYVPLGANIRLGSKKMFWKRINVYYELKPGINMTFITGLNPIASFRVQHGWGLKFTI